MTRPKPSLRVGIADTVPDVYTRHFPAGVEVVRYSVDGDDTHTVDMLVPPSFGPRAAEVLPRIQARYVQTISAGVETILPLMPPGVPLCNAQGVHDASTAEWVLAAILGSLKWLPLYDGLQREGRWIARSAADTEYEQIFGSPNAIGNIVMVEDLAGKHVLIVGYGSIGRAIEARLLPFEPASILRVARTAREGVHGIDELDALLARADIVVLITPLTPETLGLFGARQLARMRRGALLVNAGRGPVVDSNALVAALETRQIRAALDVTDPEPLPAGHPLWSAPGLLLTPHVAGSTPAFLDKVFRFVGSQLARLERGDEPANLVLGDYKVVQDETQELAKPTFIAPPVPRGGCT